MSNILNFRDQINISSGDTVRVHQTVVEGDKTRTQVFEGVVIRIRGHKGLKSFTVRKIATAGIGVERIFPELSPTVTKVEVKKKGKVRRAVLTYLGDRVGRKATKIKDVFVKGAQKAEEKDLVVTKAERSEEDELARVAKAAKASTEEKMAKEAKKAEKEKKKAKKKKKVERKEKVFVR